MNQFKQFHCHYGLLARSSSLKNEILLKMYSTSGHPRCRWVCFFIRTDLDKFCITSLAHQWIFCSEWVPSEWESKQLIKTLHKSLIDGLRSIIMYYCDVFISCLDSRSNGTHSLHRIHLWASDVMLNFSKSVPMKKQSIHFSLLGKVLL